MSILNGPFLRVSNCDSSSSSLLDLSILVSHREWNSSSLHISFSETICVARLTVTLLEQATELFGWLKDCHTKHQPTTRTKLVECCC